MNKWGNRRHRSRRAWYAAAIAVLAVASQGVSAHAAWGHDFFYTVPAAAKTAWIDIEAPNATVSNTTAEVDNGQGPVRVALKDTAFGVSAIVPVEAGNFRLSVSSGAGGDGHVSVSFAEEQGIFAASDSTRVELLPGSEEEPSTPAPTAPAVPTEKPAAPTAPAAPTVRPTDSATTPSPSPTAVPLQAVPSGSPSPHETAGSASSPDAMPSTGWSPVVLFGAIALLALGAGVVLACTRRESGK